ncbi:alpha/beta hydrolase [Kitasatospora sp. NPDC058965]|uniref:alpha/beta hydrolase n=1 Tax=Kitasatospora sp. NPDC058965 TaxID=3346682 RepID=UPI0036A3CA5D
MPRHRSSACAALLAAALTLTLAAAVPAPAASRAFAAAADDGARVVSASWLDSRLVDLTISSPAVGGTVDTRLLLPAGWSADATRSWPVLYLLHGAHDDDSSWVRSTDIERFTAGQPVIVAMPASGPTGIPTAWWHGGADRPDYETFQVTELMQLLQRDFRAGGTRAVAGVSTGGWAAVAFAARHPGAFAAAASYSGILDTTLPGMPAVVEAIVARENLDPLSLWGDPVLQFPRWAANDPTWLADRLRGTRLFLSTGTGLSGGDPAGGILESALWPAAQAFALRLRLAGIPAQEDFYAGGTHSWAYWETEYQRSWPLLAGALGLPGGS